MEPPRISKGGKARESKAREGKRREIKRQAAGRIRKEFKKY